MGLDAYLQDVLIRSQIAEAQRHAGRRHLVEQARSSNQSGTRRSALIEHLRRAASTFSSKRRVERTVLP